MNLLFLLQRILVDGKLSLLFLSLQFVAIHNHVPLDPLSVVCVAHV